MRPYLTAACGLAISALHAAPSHADTVDTLITSGSPANRINLVVLGEGYTSSSADQTKLSADANAAVTGLLSFSPYKDYRGLFNIKLVHTISQSSAIPKAGVPNPQTALGCYFGCSGIDRLICCEGGSEGSVAAVTAANVPEATVSLVIVNDATYGGSGGSFAVVSTEASAIEIARHELGHTFAGLADEYSDAQPQYPPCDTKTDCTEPNATVRAQRPGKWGQWLAAGQSVPTPDGTPGVGYFQGCRYQTTGVYRPVSSCIMRALGEQYCPVCAEAMSLALWGRVHVVDSRSPVVTAVTTTGCDAQAFEVIVPPNAGTLEIAWTVDDAVRAGAVGSKLELDPGELMPGMHTIAATVRDASPLIRSDPAHMSSSSTAWTWQTDCTDHKDSGGCCDARDRGGLGGMLVGVAAVAGTLLRRRRS